MAENKLRLLMADDDAEDLELMEDAFSETAQGDDLHLYKLDDGKRVVDYLEHLPDEALPCLIILDYNMPGMKGSEVLSKLCQLPRYEKIPKVILSTSSAPIHIEECKRNGSAAYFVKPNNLDELKDLAQKMIAMCDAA